VSTAELAQIQSAKKYQEKSITKRVEKYIRIKLKEDWSPEQISGRMKLDTGMYVVQETIYFYKT
jgi:IS30 family transposase